MTPYRWQRSLRSASLDREKDRHPLVHKARGAAGDLPAMLRRESVEDCEITDAADDELSQFRKVFQSLECRHFIGEPQRLQQRMGSQAGKIRKLYTLRPG